MIRLLPATLPLGREGVCIEWRIAHHTQDLHRTGHRHIEQACAASGAIEHLGRIHDHDGIELEALHGLGGEHRDLYALEILHPLDCFEAMGYERR